MRPPRWLTRGVLRLLFGSEPDRRRLADVRFAVVDVDVTGTSIRRDRVTGIAALPVAGGAFRISDLHYCALPGAPDSTAEGAAPWRGDYLALRELVAGNPIVTYNPDFVRQMILRACRVNRLPAFDGEWIDLAAAASLVGSEHGELTTMGYWLEKMRSGGRSPHDAAYDVFAMAQLLEAVLAYSADAGMETVESLVHRQDVRASLGRR